VTVDFPTATIVWIAFIIVWQPFEDYVVQPLVYGRTLRVNPIVTSCPCSTGRCSESSARCWRSPPPPRSRSSSGTGGRTAATNRDVPR
jgi:hypothetical protein